MRSNFDTFVAHINMLGVRPILIFLSEIWINDVEVDMYTIDGYTLHCNCNSTQRAGGVCVFVKNNFDCDIVNLNFCSADGIRINLNHFSEKFSILHFYRLHAFPVSKFLEEIEPVLSNISVKNLFIIGDLNIDLLSISHETDSYKLLMASYGLVSVINDVTRPCSGTCIDHIFVRRNCNSLTLCNPFIYDFDFVDHSSVGFFLSEITSYKADCDIVKHKIDYVHLCQSLQSESWTSVYSSMDTNLAFEHFFSILNLHIANHTKAVPIVKKDRNMKPWISKDLCKMIKFKNNLFSKTKRHSADINLKNRYKKIKKHIELEVKKEKEKYYNNLFIKNNRDSKKQWRLINGIIGGGIKRNSIACVMNTNGESLTNPKEIASEFNAFFAAIPSSLCAKIEQIQCSQREKDLLIFSNFVQEKTCFFTPTSWYEIEDQVKNLKNTNSAGIDGISSLTIKMIISHISLPLEHIINLSLSNGIFPHKLKQAILIPLHKSGVPSVLNNYRPISILSVFSKIFERLVKKRMLDFLKGTEFLSNLQFGFRENLSTEDALLKFMDLVIDGLNKSERSAGLFIDITKAFDTVNHEILINKLYNAGFRGVVLDWFRSYLSDREHVTKVGDFLSGSICVNSGVPQGSVLGPILFIIYINSLCKLDTFGKLIAFADDTAFVYNNTSWSTTEQQMNHDLELLRKWFALHSMVLSSKTRFMPFVFKNQKEDIPENLFIHSVLCNGLHCLPTCIKIERVNEFKYLGVFLDCKLDFLCHISKIKSQLNAALRKFYVLRDYCSKDTLRMLYFALVNSRLDYGIALWGSTYFESIKQILLTQKHFVRLINFKSAREPSWPIFKKMNIFPLRSLYIYKVLKLFFIRGGYLKTKNVVRYNLRVNNLCSVVFTRKEYCRRSFGIMAPSLFNSLPDLIKASSNLNIFLKHIKDWLFSFDGFSEIERYFSF